MFVLWLEKSKRCKTCIWKKQVVSLWSWGNSGEGALSVVITCLLLLVVCGILEFAVYLLLRLSQSASEKEKQGPGCDVWRTGRSCWLNCHRLPVGGETGKRHLEIMEIWRNLDWTTTPEKGWESAKEVYPPNFMGQTNIYIRFNNNFSKFWKVPSKKGYKERNPVSIFCLKD